MIRKRIPAISYLVVLIAVPPVFGQSVADVARKSRPKDAKVTSKRVFTDDDVQHSTNQNDAAPTSASTLADSLEKARSAVSQSEGQTERQYAETVVRDIRFPGRDDWEHRLYAQQLKVIASAHAVLATVASNASESVIRSAKYDFDLDVIARDHLKAEGIAKAAAWERNR